MNQEMIGKWAFIIGLIIAILAVFATSIPGITSANVLLVLFILGLVIGFLNINKKDSTNFLIAVIALMAVSGSIGALAALNVGALATLKIDILTNKVISIVSNFIALVSAAALVVSIKVALQTTKK